MEATARMPGYPGSTQDCAGAGEHIHRLLALADALGTAASHTIGEGSSATPFGLDLDSLSDAESMRWAQSLERLNHVLQALLVQSAGDLDHRVEAGRFVTTGVRNTAALLVQSLKLSRAEAYRRLRLAERFLPSADPLTATRTEARQPVLGGAFFAGNLSCDQALTASGFIDDAEHLATAGCIDHDVRDDVEETLTNHAREQAPDFLRTLGTRILSHLDPDGQQPTEGALLAKQGLFFHQPRRGLIHFEGHLTLLQYETLRINLDWATNPNQHQNTTDTDSDSDTDNDSSDSVEGAGKDRTTPGQDTLFNDLATITGLIEKTTEPARTDPNTITQPPPPPPPPPPGPVTPPVPPPPPLPVPGPPPGLKPVPGPSLWVASATDPAGIGWRTTPASTPKDDLSWLWGEPAPVTGIGWDNPPTPAPAPAPAPDDTNPHPSPDTGPGTGTGSTTFANDTHEAVHPEPTKTPGTRTAPDQPIRPCPSPVNQNIDPTPAPAPLEEMAGWDPIEPNSTNPATQDRRTHAQRLLDGLIDCVKLAAKTGKLPINGGLKTQLIITTTQEDLNRHRRDGTGTTTTPFSGPVPLTVFDEALCDAEITHLLYGKGQEILDVGRTQRLFTRPQRKILLARDMGCTFPECTANALWCEAHHIIPWYAGGPTAINNGCLLCIYHHHLLHSTEWTAQLLHGTPYYTPPYTIDPTQTPLRNNYHHDPNTP